MATDSKIRRLDCGADRISSLPRNLIEAILRHLPVHDVARTSILSRNWRNIWGTYPKLIFDDKFFSKLVSKEDKEAPLFKAVRVVNQILLLHGGPILTFYLIIPPDLPLHEWLDTDFWIKNISNNGVREFGLCNTQDIPYTMPSYLFSCFELNHLTLASCILEPPPRFGGFSNLESVRLMDVIITADISFGPKLEQLVLESCIGIKHLGSLFENHSNLSRLIIERGDIDWKLFESTQKSYLVSLMLKRVTNPIEKIVNLEKFVASMPRINKLVVDDCFLKPGVAIPKMLTTTMENIKRLCFSGVGFHDLVQIKYVLCLIRSSPNLQHLLLGPDPTDKRKDGLDLGAVSKDSVKSVEKYLHLPIKDMILDKLETVGIRDFVGSRAELRFIKLLLVSSPSLQTMRLWYSDDCKEEARSRISRELLQYNRCASTTVKLIMQ
ncbi:hypothetical protein DCAR_0934079 [Daucus carota subsp. sativus]|uniref:F-box domain-containing protein n=1 Tax=Daucus carota subsp. sativus TaxID=79200 RepID=A0AAF0XX96_DAUCS|nr:hypothetical protein DCAR_0934079 [Daucus carota subsp. sativus]